MIVVALFLLVGASIGLLGGGGSILTVPLLVFWVGLDAKTAVATSLLIVGVTSAFGLVPYARRGLVDVRVAALFGPVSMLGAFSGGWLGRYLSNGLLLGVFAVMMLTTSAAMLVRRAPTSEAPTLEPHPPTRTGARALVLVLEGAGVGMLTGLVGAGGGFMVVPALVFLARLEMRRAVGTSLLIVSLNSFTGLLGHLSYSRIDWGFGLGLAGAAAGAAILGGLLSRRIPAERLRRGFAAVVAGVGVFVLGSQLPSLGAGRARETGAVSK